MLERRWSIIQRVTDVLVNRFELSAGIHNLGRTFHVGSFKLCYNVNRALFKELRMFYGFPPSTKTQTRHVQAVTRAFSIARVSLSREQNSQTLDQAKPASCCLRKGVGGGFMGSRPARWIRHRELCTHANSQARQCRTALALICIEGLRPGKLRE